MEQKQKGSTTTSLSNSGDVEVVASTRGTEYSAVDAQQGRAV